jgi:hypothetical protein
MKQTEATPNGMPCPCCGAAGQPVKPRTLRALLAPGHRPDELLRGAGEEIVHGERAEEIP